MQIWFLPSHQDHWGIRFTKKHPDPKQDNGCMNHIFSVKNGFSRRTSERNGCRNHFFVRSMRFDANEPSVEGLLIGSEASPKRDLGTRPVNCSPPVRHMCKRARIFISLIYLFGSTTQTIMNFMPQDRLGPNALCVLEGRNQICTYIYTCIWYIYIA